ncbi:kinase-like protein, partial [Glonium stellatum]
MNVANSNPQLCRDADATAGPVNCVGGATRAQLEAQLDQYFIFLGSPENNALRRFSNQAIINVSELLKYLIPPWSPFPRLYIVLRSIGHLHELDAFIAERMTDLWFPFTRAKIPNCIDQATSQLFLRNQWIVLTNSLDLEKGKNGSHQYFGENDVLPFESLGLLGKGAYGEVDKVVSTISNREYARKRIKRGNHFGLVRRNMRDFENEMSTLKRLEHLHIVELVGSYTDPLHLGLIFSPVADCNLAQFFNSVAKSGRSLEVLQTFFGCLATGVAFIHSKEIRHKDIKPENILVKCGKLLITDFGIALNWGDTGSSITQDTSPLMTRRYSAPELLDDAPRDSSADLWSLGCVYLEMITVLRGHTIPELRSFLEGFGSRSTIYAKNTDGVLTWINKLRVGNDPVTANLPLEWIKATVKKTPSSRPSAQVLLDTIKNCFDSAIAANGFIGTCCQHTE